VDPLVHGCLLLLVAAEAHVGELGVADHAGIHRGDADAPDELAPHDAGERELGGLRADVHPAPRIGLAPRPGAEVDDVPAPVLHVRQAEARHPREPEDVCLEHPPVVLVVALRDRGAAESQAGVVDQDVEAPKPAGRVRNEPFAAGRIGDVELGNEMAFPR
jgi:hypothetical protein